MGNKVESVPKQYAKKLYWGESSMCYNLQHYLDVSDQLHALMLFPQRKNPL